MPKAIEITVDQRTPDWLTVTATVTGVDCSCGMFLPLPLEPAGRYGIICPNCEQHHFVSVETEESEREKAREKRWLSLNEPTAQSAKTLGEL